MVEYLYLLKAVGVFVSYRSPTTLKGLLTTSAHCVKKYKNNPIWVAGDFNLPDIDWPTNTTTGN